MRLLLSVIICPVFENTLSDGTDVATMHNLLSITFVKRGQTEARSFHQLSGSAALEMFGASRYDLTSSIASAEGTRLARSSLQGK